ncbi:hypothetical protein P7C70_g8875, partial [Phenoliferia sp. Uapishka_3]
NISKKNLVASYEEVVGHLLAVASAFAGVDVKVAKEMLARVLQDGGHGVAREMKEEKEGEKELGGEEKSGVGVGEKREDAEKAKERRGGENKDGVVIDSDVEGAPTSSPTLPSSPPSTPQHPEFGVGKSNVGKSHRHSLAGPYTPPLPGSGFSSFAYSNAKSSLFSPYPAAESARPPTFASTSSAFRSSTYAVESVTPFGQRSAVIANPFKDLVPIAKPIEELTEAEERVRKVADGKSSPAARMSKKSPEGKLPPRSPGVNESSTFDKYEPVPTKTPSRTPPPVAASGPPTNASTRPELAPPQASNGHNKIGFINFPASFTSALQNAPVPPFAKLGQGSLKTSTPPVFASASAPSFQEQINRKSPFYFGDTPGIHRQTPPSHDVEKLLPTKSLATSTPAISSTEAPAPTPTTPRVEVSVSGGGSWKITFGGDSTDAEVNISTQTPPPVFGTTPAPQVIPSFAPFAPNTSNASPSAAKSRSHYPGALPNLLPNVFTDKVEEFQNITAHAPYDRYSQERPRNQHGRSINSDRKTAEPIEPLQLLQQLGNDAAGTSHPLALHLIEALLEKEPQGLDVEETLTAFRSASGEVRDLTPLDRTAALAFMAAGAVVSADPAVGGPGAQPLTDISTTSFISPQNSCSVGAVRRRAVKSLADRAWASLDEPDLAIVATQTIAAELSCASGVHPHMTVYSVKEVGSLPSPPSDLTPAFGTNVLDFVKLFNALVVLLQAQALDIERLHPKDIIDPSVKTTEML